MVFPVAPLRPFCAHTRQSKTPLSVQIVHSRICDHLISSLFIETNGRASSSKQTKHIKVKYFLIKDKVDWEEITIEHCPTEQMWMDINTKPKQGAVFRAFRGHIMGIPTYYKDASFATRCNFRPPNWIPEQVSSSVAGVCWRQYKGTRTDPSQAGCEGLVCCRRGGSRRTNQRANQTGSTCTNQDSGWTCLEPRYLPGSEATGEKPRCSMGEGVYSPSHFYK